MGVAAEGPSRCPLVSVIIPVFNTSAYLEKCLRSVAEQTLRDIEAVIVDDCSTDASAELAAEFAATDDRFRLIRHSVNRGLPATRNTGLRSASGRYVSHLDSDDYLPHDALASLVEIAEQDRADVVIGHGAVDSDGRLAVWGHSLARCQRMRRGIRFEDDPRLWTGGNICLMLFRRAFIEAHQIWFDETYSYGEDQIYTAKVLPKAKSISMLPRMVYCYRIGHGSMSSPGGWPNSRWRDLGGWVASVAHYLQDHEIALQYNLIAQAEWRMGLLTMARRDAPAEVFEGVLNKYAEAYRHLRLERFLAMRDAMPGRVPHLDSYLRPLLEALAVGDMSAASKEVDKLAGNRFTWEYFDLQWKSLQGWSDGAALACQACQTYPDNPLLACYHANILKNQKEFDRAIAECLRAQAIDPELPDPLITLIELYLKTERPEEAVATGRSAVEAFPYHATLRYWFGKALLATHQLDGAEAEQRMAATLDPSFFLAHLELITVLERRGLTEEALALARSVFQEFPFLPRVQRHVIDVLIRSGPLEEAVAVLENAALSLDPRINGEWNKKLLRARVIALRKRMLRQHTPADARLLQRAAEIADMLGAAHSAACLRARSERRSAHAAARVKIDSSEHAPLRQ